MIDPALLQSLLRPGDSAASLDDRINLLRQLRADPAAESGVLRALLGHLDRQHQALRKSEQIHNELKQVIARLTASPWYPATFIAALNTREGPRALVQHGAGQRIVSVAEGLAVSSLQVGDEVYLGHEMNVILDRNPDPPARSGETCHYERRLDAARLVVKSRDEEIIVHAAPGLLAMDLKPGDLLRWAREQQVAYEKIERAKESSFFLEETPAETFDDVGGLGDQINRIKRTLLLHYQHQPVARRYRVAPKGSILLCGPAGTGKTLVAKALANWMAQLAPTGRSLFMNIKPGALHSVWYSQSEQNYREVFRVAREAAAATPGLPVILFFDEVDAVGSSRGHSYMRVHDNVLTALIAELDGLAQRGRVLVVAATNRREALDPALTRPGRLGDLVLDVPRPNAKAAREIFAKHFHADIPYAHNGHGPDFAAARQEMIEAAVARIYAANGESELATLTFRDGKRRVLRGPDLISGALIANMARSALERASLREVETGDAGVQWVDLLEAITEEFDSAVRALTPFNCRQHLTGLPHDLDVVNVEPVVRRVARSYQYLNAA